MEIPRLLSKVIRFTGVGATIQVIHYMQNHSLILLLMLALVPNQQSLHYGFSIYFYHKIISDTFTFMKDINNE